MPVYTPTLPGDHLAKETAPLDGETLVREHRGLVFNLCRRYRKWAADVGEDLEDLTQVAFLELLRQLHKYEPERGAFGTFAGLTVKQAMHKHLGRRQRLQPWPRTDEGEPVELAAREEND